MTKLKTLLCLIPAVLRTSNLFGDSMPPVAEMVATNSLSLEQVVGEVLSNNPSLKAARANWEAMKERIPQARAWEDPRAGVDVNAGRFVAVPANSFTDQKFMVEQTLPLSGKNRLRGQAASAEAVNAFAEFQRRELDATAAARSAYFRLANAYAQLELNRKNTGLLRQFAEISRTKYEVGTHSQADVLSAETELAKLEETAFDFQRQISEAQTKLNTLMDHPAHSPLGHPAVQTFEPVALTLEKVESLALVNRPELLMAEKKIEAAQARLDAAHKEWIPEPSFRVEADRYNGASQAISEVAAGFSINLPWFNRAKYKAGVRENQKLVESARLELAAARRETLALVWDQLKKVETFHHHTELSKTKLLPLAEQTVISKRLSYETDKTSFLELLTAQQSVQEIESMYWEHLADYQMALAELEALVGTSLEPVIDTAEHQHDSK
ncbi:MAG: Outer rane efflux protein [Pedosphaera sp.]|jgi:cobalt-zinc-cadmium efflux system outer membrane protein|nr:Outer rane efflux protein [Pedosphaera sp.]